MLSLVIAATQYLLPVLLITIPAIWIIEKHCRHPQSEPEEQASQPQPPEPDMNEMEKKLALLIEKNQADLRIDELKQNLENSKTGIIANYLKTSKKDLQGFHLFQLIFSLIKNNSDDHKIIKILRHTFPSCATTHLYAMLRSFKAFLNIPSCATTHLYAMLRSFKAFLNITDGTTQQKELEKTLNNNQIRQTLIYLEEKINTTLNKLTTTPNYEQQQQMDLAAIYGLVFATFSEFYNHQATERILRLVYILSPEMFKSWHTLPETEDKATPPALIIPHIAPQKKQLSQPSKSPQHTIPTKENSLER